MFAEFIIRLRKARRWSKSFMASALLMSRPTYLQVEKGERDLTIGEAEKLAQLFEMPLENFLQQQETDFLVTIQEKVPTKKAKKETIRISVPQQKAKKFKEVLCYILRKVGGKPNIGMTVLYKLLYFIDFDYYEKYEEQLMGLQYIKNYYGPTPILFKKVVDNMVQNGELEIFTSNFYQYPQTKYMINPVIEPDLSILNGQEKQHIDEELQRLSDMSAAQLSALSHRDVPWITAEEGQAIDYEAVFYRTHETSVRDYLDGN